MVMGFWNLLRRSNPASFLIFWPGQDLTSAYRFRWRLVSFPVPMGLGENFVTIKRNIQVLWRGTWAAGEFCLSSSYTIRFRKAF